MASESACLPRAFCGTQPCGPGIRTPLGNSAGGGYGSLTGERFAICGATVLVTPEVSSTAPNPRT